MKKIVKPTELQVTTWALGTSVAYTICVNMAMYLKTQEVAYGVLSVIFAILLPVFVTDPRKNLRSLGYCCSMWVLTLLEAFAYCWVDMILALCCLGAIICISAIAFCVVHACKLPALFRRKTKGYARIQNEAILTRVYYSAYFTFCGVFIKEKSMCLCVVMWLVAAALAMYIVYYWGWAAELSKQAITIHRLGREHRFDLDKIRRVKRVPLLGYMAYGKNGRILFGLPPSGENCAYIAFQIGKSIHN